MSRARDKDPVQGAAEAAAALPPPGTAVPELDRLTVGLTKLGLTEAAAYLPALMGEAVKQDITAPLFLERLLEQEHRNREERRIRTSLKLSGLPLGQTLSNFDFAFQPAVERSRIDALATCGWVKKAGTTLLLGPPGVGKTHLAVALGVRAVEQGFSTTFYRVEELLHDLRQDAHVPPARLRRRKYMNSALLIIDEVGFEPFSREEANLFFRLVSHRYQKGAFLITSNKAIREWPEMLAGDEVITAAILDRLLHASTVLNIKGRSYRLRDLEEGMNAAS